MSKRRTDRGRGRPVTANDFRLIVVPRHKPDLRRLGGALVALALHHPQHEGDRATTSTEARDGSA